MTIFFCRTTMNMVLLTQISNKPANQIALFCIKLMNSVIISWNYSIQLLSSSPFILSIIHLSKCRSLLLIFQFNGYHKNSDYKFIACEISLNLHVIPSQIALEASKSPEISWPCLTLFSHKSQLKTMESWKALKSIERFFIHSLKLWIIYS